MNWKFETRHWKSVTNLNRNYLGISKCQTINLNVISIFKVEQNFYWFYPSRIRRPYIYAFRNLKSLFNTSSQKIHLKCTKIWHGNFRNRPGWIRKKFLGCTDAIFMFELCLSFDIICLPFTQFYRIEWHLNDIHSRISILSAGILKYIFHSF